jgi:hypothetical protein
MTGSICNFFGSREKVSSGHPTENGWFMTASTETATITSMFAAWMEPKTGL